MKTIQVRLNSIAKTTAFVNRISKFDSDFELMSGKYTVDAKSIMGVLSLDLAKPVQLCMHGSEEECAEVEKLIAEFID